MPTSVRCRRILASRASGWLAIQPGLAWERLPAYLAAKVLRNASSIVYIVPLSTVDFSRSLLQEVSIMKELTRSEQTIPALDELGLDLLITTRKQRSLALARPFAGLALYILAVSFGLWWLTPLIVFLIFVAVVTVTHDVVHRSLGLTQRQTEWALFLMGAVLMESGHAYRTTHVQHHKYFPADDDPEGYPAKISLLGAMLYGPIFLYRLWWWAFRRNKGRTGQRAWMITEALVPLIVVV